MAPLEQLVAAHDRKELDTWPLLVVRHAKAKPRSSWTKAEGDRPLAATGLRQAQAVRRLLHVWKPMRVHSSPWQRCVATIAPYAKSAEAKVKLHDALTEHRHAPQPQEDRRRRRITLRQTARHCPVHAPARTATVIKQLGEHMNGRLRALLPSSDPYLAPGEIIVCHVARGSNHKIVAVEQFRPFDD